jgi:hypothetical protein
LRSRKFLTTRCKFAEHTFCVGSLENKAFFNMHLIVSRIFQVSTASLRRGQTVETVLRANAIVAPG